MQNELSKYRKAHWWLLIPTAIILLGFWSSYFTTFFDEPFGHHLHALSAMGWFVLLIIQPYLATTGRLKHHRLWGMIGLFLAGAVVFSALAISPSNVYYGEQGGFPPQFPGPFFYGITLTETLAIIGFAGAVIMAIVRSKQLAEHAIWMTSTVFFALMPAWGRAAMMPVFIFEWDYSQSDVMRIAVPIFLLAIVITGIRLKKLWHPAFILAALVNITMLFVEPVGSSPWYQDFITRLMKPVVPW